MKNSFRTKHIVLITVVGLLTFNCASIFKGSSADVRVNSTPSGAEIFINGIDRGTTPQTMSLKRNKDYVLTFKKEGYEDLNFEIHKKFDVGTTVVGNIFSWGLLGILVDLGTGAAFSLTPADIEANMEALQQAGYIKSDLSAKEGEIHVFMITTDEWEALTAEK